jgi:thioredoxin-related protein
MKNQDSNVLLMIALFLSVALVGVWWWKTSNESKVTGPDNWNQPWSQYPNQPLPQNQNPQKPQSPPPKPNGPDLNLDVPKNYQEAVSTARQQNKKMFVMFEASWCNWCQKMKSETLNDPRVRSALNGYVIYYADKDQERTLSQKHRVTSIPAYFVASSSERVEIRGSGYKNVDEFLNWLNGKPDRWPDRWQDRSPG